MDRRHFLTALPALALAPRLAAQSAPASLKVRGLSQLTLTVSDVGRSLKFYQDLFGMPIQARQGTTLFLRIGSGPQFLALKQAAAGERPSISAFGMGVEDFSIDRVRARAGTERRHARHRRRIGARADDRARGAQVRPERRQRTAAVGRLRRPTRAASSSSCTTSPTAAAEASTAPTAGWSRRRRPKGCLPSAT